MCAVQPRRRPGGVRRHQHRGPGADGARRAGAAGSLDAGGAKEDVGSAGGKQARKERARPDAARAILHEVSAQRAALECQGRRGEGLGGPAWGPDLRHSERP